MQTDFLEVIKAVLPIKTVLSILWQLWPVWIIMLAAIAFRLLFDWLDLEIDNWHIRRRFKNGEAWRSDRDLLYWLRRMKPSEFEDYIADLFSRLGYKTRAVGQSHDGGIDVIAEKDGITNYIQCKKFITSQVPVGAVRDFYGALADHLANGQGYFVTTNKFTLEARKFTEDKPIELVDGFELIRYIQMAKKDEEPNAKPVSQPSQLCPKCGGKLIERTGKFGTFYGCLSYPKRKYITNKN